MSVERADFLLAFNAVEVPAPILTTDVIDTQAIAATNTFFQDVERSLDLGPRTLDAFFERDIVILTSAAEPKPLSSEYVRPEDDYMAMYKKCGGQVIASVLFLRNDLRHQIAHFTKYQLLPATVDEIRELQYFDDVTHGLE